MLYILKVYKEMFAGQINGAYKLHLFASQGNINAIKSLLTKPAWRNRINAQDYNGNTPLSWAVVHGHVGTVQFLFHSGADINAKGKDGATLLHWAACCGHIEIIKLLLEGGVDVNAQANDGSTPLHWSSQNNHEQVVKFLLEKKAAVDFTDKEGRTPLYIAAKNGNEKVVELLVQRGANVDIQTIKNKVNPLLTASYNGNKKIVELLINRKANLNVTDAGGFTPAYLALTKDNGEILNLLLDNGAGIKCEGNISILDYKDKKSGKEYIRTLQDIKLSEQLLPSYSVGPSTPSQSRSKNPESSKQSGEFEEFVKLFDSFGLDITKDSVEVKNTSEQQPSTSCSVSSVDQVASGSLSKK